MSHSWASTVLDSKNKAVQVLIELSSKGWLYRGQSKRYNKLVPSIDRSPRQKLLRLAKLLLERQSINLFRSAARFFVGAGEQGALVNDMIALMVLRHYGVPTRLLDWSKSPWVAAFFAVQENDEKDGEIWSFDEPLYEIAGREQWKIFPETTIDNSGNPDKFDYTLKSAFTTSQPHDWFVCNFYDQGFPRQLAQEGAYTMTARFNCDHAESIERLLSNPSHHHLYIVDSKIKATLRRVLREHHGIWPGSLYPDSAGAAAIACDAFNKASNKALQRTAHNARRR